MKFCFGTFINVLFVCSVQKTTKLKLCNAIVKSVDSNCNLTANAVTNLMKCATNLPDGRSNSLGDVISLACEADPQKTAEYFQKKIMPLIESDKRKLAVLALREIIVKDDFITGDTVIDTVSGITKKALQKQSRFELSESDPIFHTTFRF